MRLDRTPMQGDSNLTLNPDTHRAATPGPPWLGCGRPLASQLLQPRRTVDSGQPPTPNPRTLPSKRSF